MPVYRGMIVGEHSCPQDLDINPLRSKQLTNIRAAGKDYAVRLSPPRPIPLTSRSPTLPIWKCQLSGQRSINGFLSSTICDNVLNQRYRIGIR